MRFLIARIRRKLRRKHGIPIYELKTLTPEEEAEKYKDHIVTDSDELREVALWMLPDLEKFGKDYQRYWLKTYSEQHNINLDDIEI